MDDNLAVILLLLTVVSIFGAFSDWIVSAIELLELQLRSLYFNRILGNWDKDGRVAVSP